MMRRRAKNTKAWQAVEIFLLKLLLQKSFP